MDKLRVWERVGYLLFAVAGGVLVIAIGHAFDLSKGDWAAWVQAVGSIGAVAGAYLVGERQAQTAYRNDLAVQMSENKRRRSAILAIVKAAAKRTEEVTQIYDLKCPSSFDIFLCYDAKFFQDLIDALSAIQILELGSYDTVSSFLDLKNRFVLLKRSLDKDQSLLDEALSKGSSEFTEARGHTIEMVRINAQVFGQYVIYFERMLIAVDLES